MADRSVTPKKLPGGLGWGVLVGEGGQPGETVSVTTRRGKQWAATLDREVQPGVWSTTETAATPGRTRERLERHAGQRSEWAESRERKGETSWEEGRKIADSIPLGQPILVGHHSERAHRRDLKRIHKKSSESVEHFDMARRHGEAARTLERQLGESIYDDDEDAIEALEERIAGLEAQRERIKDLNRRIRKGESLDSLDLTEKEAKDLEFAARWHGRKDFPPYVLQNLGGNITRNRQRLETLRALLTQAEPSPAAEDTEMSAEQRGLTAEEIAEAWFRQDARVRYRKNETTPGYVRRTMRSDGFHPNDDGLYTLPQVQEWAKLQQVYGMREDVATDRVGKVESAISTKYGVTASTEVSPPSDEVVEPTAADATAPHWERGIDDHATIPDTTEPPERQTEPEQKEPAVTMRSPGTRNQMEGKTLLFEYGLANDDSRAVAVNAAAKDLDAFEDTRHGRVPYLFNEPMLVRQAEQYRARIKYVEERIAKLKPGGMTRTQLENERDLKQAWLAENEGNVAAAKEEMLRVDGLEREYEQERRPYIDTFEAAKQVVEDADDIDIEANAERLRGIQAREELGPQDWYAKQRLDGMVRAWTERASALQTRRRTEEREARGYQGETAMSGGVRFTFQPDPRLSDDAAAAVQEATLLAADGKQIPPELRTRMVEGGMDPGKAELFKTPRVTPDTPGWRYAARHGEDHVNPFAMTVTRQRDDGTWEEAEQWAAMKQPERKQWLKGDDPDVEGRPRRQGDPFKVHGRLKDWTPEEWLVRDKGATKEGVLAVVGWNIAPTQRGIDNILRDLGWNDRQRRWVADYLDELQRTGQIEAKGRQRRWVIPGEATEPWAAAAQRAMQDAGQDPADRTEAALKVVAETFPGDTSQMRRMRNLGFDYWDVAQAGNRLIEKGAMERNDRWQLVPVTGTAPRTTPEAIPDPGAESYAYLDSETEPIGGDVTEDPGEPQMIYRGDRNDIDEALSRIAGRMTASAADAELRKSQVDKTIDTFEREGRWPAAEPPPPPGPDSQGMATTEQEINLDSDEWRWLREEAKDSQIASNIENLDLEIARYQKDPRRWADVIAEKERERTAFMLERDRRAELADAPDESQTIGPTSAPIETWEDGQFTYSVRPNQSGDGFFAQIEKPSGEVVQISDKYKTQAGARKWASQRQAAFDAASVPTPEPQPRAPSRARDATPTADGDDTPPRDDTSPTLEPDEHTEERRAIAREMTDADLRDQAAVHREDIAYEGTPQADRDEYRRMLTAIDEEIERRGSDPVEPAAKEWEQTNTQTWVHPSGLTIRRMKVGRKHKFALIGPSEGRRSGIMAYYPTMEEAATDANVGADETTLTTEAPIPREHAITGDTKAEAPSPRAHRERTASPPPADVEGGMDFDIPPDAPVDPPADASAVRPERGDAPPSRVPAPSRSAPSGDPIGDLLDRLTGRDRQILERVLDDREKGEASAQDVKEIAAMLAKRNPPKAPRVSGAQVPIRERKDALGQLTKEQAHVRATTNFTADELATVNDLYRAERDAIEMGIETTDIRRDRQKIIDDAKKRGNKQPSERARSAAVRERGRTVGGRSNRPKDKDLRSSPAAVGGVSIIVRS